MTDIPFDHLTALSSSLLQVLDVSTGSTSSSSSSIYSQLRLSHRDPSIRGSADCSLLFSGPLKILTTAPKMISSGARSNVTKSAAADMLAKLRTSLAPIDLSAARAMPKSEWSSQSAINSLVLTDIDMRIWQYPLPTGATSSSLSSSASLLSSSYNEVSAFLAQCPAFPVDMVSRSTSSSSSSSMTSSMRFIETLSIHDALYSECLGLQVNTSSRSSVSASSASQLLFYSVVAIDCEMCEGVSGDHVLARVTVVGLDPLHHDTDKLKDNKANAHADPKSVPHVVLLDEYVLPSEAIADYRTQWSGITEALLSARARLSADEVTARLLALIPQETLLVGHSLDCDLRVLRLLHRRCADTSILFPHPKGFPYRQKLKYLAKRFLGCAIQTSGASNSGNNKTDSGSSSAVVSTSSSPSSAVTALASASSADNNVEEISSASAGHDSEEDAITALRLLLLKALYGRDYGVSADRAGYVSGRLPSVHSSFLQHNIAVRIGSSSSTSPALHESVDTTTDDGNDDPDAADSEHDKSCAANCNRRSVAQLCLPLQLSSSTSTSTSASDSAVPTAEKDNELCVVPRSFVLYEENFVDDAQLMQRMLSIRRYEPDALVITLLQPSTTTFMELQQRKIASLKASRLSAIVWTKEMEKSLVDEAKRCLTGLVSFTMWSTTSMMAQ